MARIAYPDPDALASETKERLVKLGSLNVSRMMAHQPGLMTAWSRMGVELLTRGRLDPVLREAVILRVGQLCRSDYEWEQHVSVARAVGMDGDMLDAIAAEKFDGMPDRFRIAIAFAGELHEYGAVSAETFTAGQQLFDPGELVELVTLIGYYRMTAGFLRCFEIETDAMLLGTSFAARPPRL